MITRQDLQAAFQRIDKKGNKRINYPQFKDNLLDEDATKLQLEFLPRQSSITIEQPTTLETPVKTTETPVKSSPPSGYYPSYASYIANAPFVPRIHDYLTFPEVSTTTITYKDTYLTPSPYKYSSETKYERFERYPSHRPIYKGDGEYYRTHHYSPVSSIETVTYTGPSYEFRYVAPLPGEAYITTVEHTYPVSPLKMRSSYTTTYRNVRPPKYSNLRKSGEIPAVPRRTESTMAASKFMGSSNNFRSGREERTLNKSSVISTPNLKSKLYESSIIAEKYDSVTKKI